MVTLQKLADISGDKLVQGFISEMADNSYLMDNMVFDNCVSANGGSDLVYGYKRLTTYATAKFRDLGADAPASTVDFTKVTTNLGILSDKLTIDRVAVDAAPDLYQEYLTEIRNSIVRGFTKQIVFGEKGTNGFNGLTEILKGTSTEITGQASLAAVDDKAEALKFAADMDNILSQLMRDPDVILVSRNTKNKMNAAARLIGMGTSTQDAAGHRISAWDSLPLYVVEGMKEGDIIPVCFGMDAFHGITLKGDNAVSVYLPDFTAPGAQKAVEAEFVCGCALKNTKGAGILHLAKPAAAKKAE